MAIKDVTATINGSTVTLTDNGDGTYSANLTAPNRTSYNVNSGHYYPVSITATNLAGTSTTVDDTHVTLGQYLKLRVKEISAPTIRITTPTTGQFLGVAQPTITIEVIDEKQGSGIDITSLKATLDGTNYTNTSSGVTVTTYTKDETTGYRITLVPPTALADGSHTLIVEVSDNDGNKATSSALQFYTDTIAPSLSVTNPSTNGTYVSDSVLYVKGTTSDSVSGIPTITIKLNNGQEETATVSNGSFNHAVTLVNGNNTIVVTATDKAGKITTITRTIILDTSSPVFASITITPNPVNVGGSYTVTVKVS